MIKYEIDINTQVVQYHLVAQSIANGFFQKNRYYLLKSLPEKFRTRIVLFPEIKSYQQNFEELSHLAKHRNEIAKYLPQKVLDEIESYTKQHIHFLTDQIERTKSEFDLIENDFITALKEEFPQLPSYEIIIQPKLFGTSGSYLSYTQEGIIVYPRYDCKSTSGLILAAIVHSIKFPKNQYIDNQVFIDKQLMVQKIAESPRFVKFKKTQGGTISMLQSKFVAKYAVESAEYYTRLGYPLQSYITDSRKVPGLTDTEKRILEKLMANRCKIVSFEEIAEIMWGENATKKYSLYAITKVINRIKKKIFDTGIHTALIHTQRGEGYLLYD